MVNKNVCSFFCSKSSGRTSGEWSCLTNSINMVLTTTISPPYHSYCHMLPATSSSHTGLKDVYSQQHWLSHELKINQRTIYYYNVVTVWIQGYCTVSQVQTLQKQTVRRQCTDSQQNYPVDQSVYIKGAHHILEWIKDMTRTFGHIVMLLYISLGSNFRIHSQIERGLLLSFFLSSAKTRNNIINIVLVILRF